MKLNLVEKLLVNNPVRALVQRFYEGPLLQKLGGRLDDARVLDVGSGRGVGVQILLEQFGAGQVYGIDLDPQQVCRAKKRFAGTSEGRVVLAVGSVEELPTLAEVMRRDAARVAVARMLDKFVLLKRLSSAYKSNCICARSCGPLLGQAYLVREKQIDIVHLFCCAAARDGVFLVCLSAWG